jgi:SAM-dependent methyltransferase
MELQEERLIDEILWESAAGPYCPWPRTAINATGSPEIATLKSRLRRIWNAGDYDRLSRYMEDGAEGFYGRLAAQPGSTLLDVACGSGQLALIAARHGVDATGVDVAESLVARARERARVERLGAHFKEADTEALPFADASFDVVASHFGVIFAPRPELVTGELLRVCRPGGIIAMANWTPQGFIGQLFKTVSKFVAPSGMPEPVLWGDEATVRERFGAGVSSLELTRRNFVFNFPFPPSEVVRFFRLYHGPTNRAFASLNRAGRKSLQKEMEELWSTYNLARGGFTKVDAEWLEVIAVRA